MKLPKFKSESEEADWWYANRRKVERELRNAKPVADANGKPMTPAAIARKAAAARWKDKPAGECRDRLTVADAVNTRGIRPNSANTPAKDKPATE